MRYTRVVGADGGASRFDDAKLELAEQQVADGVSPMFVGSLSAESSVVFLRSADFDSHDGTVPTTGTAEAPGIDCYRSPPRPTARGPVLPTAGPRWSTPFGSLPSTPGPC